MTIDDFRTVPRKGSFSFRDAWRLAAAVSAGLAAAAAVCSFVRVPGWLEADVWSWRRFAARTLLLSVPLSALALHLFWPAERIWGFVDRNRFRIAAAILFVATLLELNGSSIGMWNQYLPNDKAAAPLFGVPRGIRSDEWAVFTPMTLAQSFARPSWPYFNDIPRAARTDMFSVYAQPVRHPLVVFRPFLAGHVLFGFRRGLAFFWVGRWLALLLAAYELFKLLTDGSKALSGAAAALILFSPVVQWWGAINALAEMLVFGSLFVVCLDRFMTGRTLRDRWLPIAGMAYCGVAYAMTLYPAAMVPLAYAFAALSLWTVLRRAKGFRADAATWAFAALAALVAAGCLGWYLHLSGDAFRTTAGTVYPGSRFHCGGGAKAWHLCRSWGDLFLPWTSDGALNSFELSAFFDFFPLGLGLAVFLFVRRGVRDLASLLLVAVSLLLGLYCLVGLPHGAAGTLLLSRSTPSRSLVALGFVQLLLLVRSVSLLRPVPSVRRSLLCAAAFAVLAVWLSRLAYPAYLGWPRLLAVGVAAAASASLLLRFSAWPRTAAFFFVVLAFAAGGFVNPVQRGDAGVLSSDLARTIRSIAEREGGAWAVDGETLPMNQYPLLVGAPTVNAGNVYPVLERWAEADPDGKDRQTWNRYAVSMRFDVRPDGGPSFRPLVQDSFQCDVPLALLGRWNVRWVLSRRRGLKGLSGGGLRLRRVAKASGWYVYAVEPNPESTADPGPTGT